MLAGSCGTVAGSPAGWLPAEDCAWRGVPARQVSGAAATRVGRERQLAGAGPGGSSPHL